MKYYDNVVIVGQSYRRDGKGSFCRKAKHPMTEAQLDELLANNINNGFADKVTIYVGTKEYATWTR